MKKLFITLSAAVFALVACNKETPVVEKGPAEATKLAFNFQVNHPDDTKAVKTAWENGDKIYVFFEGISGEGKYLTLSYNGSAWTSYSTNDLAVGDFGADGSTVTMHAVFFPFEQPEITAVDEGFTFKTKSEGHTAATAGLGIYTYYMTNTPESATCTVTVDGEIKTLGGTLSMTLPAGFVQFYIPAAGGKYNADYKYRLSIEGVKPTACVAFNADYKYGNVTYKKTVPAITNNFSTKELAAAQPMWGYPYGDGIAFSGVIDGTWSSAADHIIYLFDTEAAAKTKTVNTTLASHAAVKFTSVNTWAAAAMADSSPLAYSGTAWARFNLGATAEGTVAENYGWYFAWGDIIPVLGTDVADAPSDYGVVNFLPPTLDYYYDNTIVSEASYARGYNLTDSFEIYDPVRAFLGSPWRMPSQSEVSSLIADPEKNSWDAGNEALTANGVIFPKPGRWQERAYNNSDHLGVYWTSSLSGSGAQYATRFLFNYESSGCDVSWGAPREYSYPIRPVKDATVVPASGTTGENLAAWE